MIYNIKRQQREKSLEKPGFRGENLLQVKSLFYYAFCSLFSSVLYVFLCVVVVVVEPDFNVRRVSLRSILPGQGQRPSQYIASMCTNLSTSTRRAPRTERLFQHRSSDSDLDDQLQFRFCLTRAHCVYLYNSAV